MNEEMVKKECVSNIIEENKKLINEIEEYKAQIKEYKAVINAYEKAEHDSKYTTELRFRDGIIEGLKFSIRCNGVSGAEVKKWE